MKAITFLGTGPYKETTYVFDGQTMTTTLFPLAMLKLCQPVPEQLLIFVTEEARQTDYYRQLCDALAGQMDLRSVEIPKGSHEQELWTIFDKLTECVNEGDVVRFDITHGLRSLPFVVFLAAAYLKVARQVKIERILYGAFDVRDTSVDPPRTPVFDLTPFVALLDWTIATERFISMGDARDIAQLLKNQMPPGPQRRDDLAARQLGKSLRSAAEAMEAISLALRVNRPLESMQASYKLVTALEQHRNILERKTRPFALLIDQIAAAYKPFALDKPEESANWQRNLRIQLDLIDWYLEKEEVVLAVTLAREWLVSAVLYRLDSQRLADRKQREATENALNNEAERQKPENLRRPPLCTPLDEPFRQLPQHEQIGQVWTKLCDLRNDLAHVLGKRKAKDVQRDAQKYFKEVKRWLAPGLLGAGEPEA